jgi:hypothetical protein
MCSINNELVNNDSVNDINQIKQLNDVDLFLLVSKTPELMNNCELWKAILEKDLGHAKGNIVFKNLSASNIKSFFECYMFRKYNNKILYLDAPSKDNIDLTQMQQFLWKLIKDIKMDHVMSAHKTKDGIKLNYKSKYMFNISSLHNYITNNSPNTPNTPNTPILRENGKLLNIYRNHIDYSTQRYIYNQDFYILIDNTYKGVRFNIVGLKDAASFNNWVLFLNVMIEHYLRSLI